MTYVTSPNVAALVKAYQPFYQLPQDGLIGWGHKLKGEYEFRDYADGITMPAAEYFLQLDISSAEIQFNVGLAQISPDLKQHEYDALISLYLDFHGIGSSFLLKEVLSNNPEGVAKEFEKLGRMHKKGTTKARRAAEARLFFTGTFME